MDHVSKTKVKNIHILAVHVVYLFYFNVLSDLAIIANKISNETLCYHFQGSADKLAKSLESQLGDLNDKLDQASRQANELSSDKSRLSNQNNDLQRQLEEALEQVNALNKAKSSLAKQLEEANTNLEDESRQKSKFQSEARNLAGDLDSMRDQLEQESEAASDLQRAVKKAQDEAHMWKAKFDSGEGGVSSEALDELKKKLSRQLRAVEEQLESATAKANSADKDRRRLQAELEDSMVDAEKVSL